MRFYNVIPNVNQDFHLRASLVVHLDELSDKKQLSIKDKSKEISVSLNKVTDVLSTLNFAQYYNEMTMKLVKDSSEKRSLRLKFSKQDSQEMVYINDCGIEFSNQKYQAEQNCQFEFEIKSFYLKGIMDLSHKLEENILFNFQFAENKLEIVLASQNMSMIIDCITSKKAIDSKGYPV